MQVLVKPTGPEIKLTKRETESLDKACQLLEALGKHGEKDVAEHAGKAVAAIGRVQYCLDPDVADDPMPSNLKTAG